MTTIRHVAELAGVSTATVSRVLNGLGGVAPETIVSVRKAVRTLNYFPSSVARSLRQGTTRAVGLVLSDAGNPFFSEVLGGVSDRLQREGYSTLVCSSAESSEAEKKVVDVLVERRVDGMILAPSGNLAGSARVLNSVRRRGIPTVLVDRTLQGIDLPSVVSCSREGAFSATDYLLQKGHRRIGMLLGIPTISTTMERVDGYQQALRQYGVGADPELMVCGESKIEEGYRASIRLLSCSDRPTAIFACNNLMMIGLLRAIRDCGVSCPREVSVVCFDDMDWAAAFSPALTTVAQDPQSIGTRAAELLMGVIRGTVNPEDATSIRVPVRLIVRDSVRDLGQDCKKKMAAQSDQASPGCEKQEGEVVVRAEINRKSYQEGT